MDDPRVVSLAPCIYRPSKSVKQALCHCNACQTSSSSAFSTNLVVPAALLSLSSSSTLKTFKRTGESGSEVTQSFCSNCGSTLFSQTAVEQAKDLRFVKAGTLKDEGKEWLKKHPPAMENMADRGLGWATGVLVKQE